MRPLTPLRKNTILLLYYNSPQLAEIQIYFQLEKGLSHMDIDNGRILGHAMMWKKPKVNKISHMLRILHGSEAMRELMKQYDWMPLFFSELRKGKLGLNSSVNTKLVCVGDEDAKQIGRNMIPALKSRKTAEAGILQWRRQNPSMDELLKERPWLESLLVVVGRGVVKAAAWGLLWRVSIGAILSLLDLTTDIYVGWEFFSRQRWVFGGRAKRGLSKARPERSEARALASIKSPPCSNPPRKKNTPTGGSSEASQWAPSACRCSCSCW